MGHIRCSRAISIAGRTDELNAIIRQDSVYPVGNSGNQFFQEQSCRLAVFFVEKLNKRKLAGAVNPNKQIEFSLFCANLHNIDMEVTNRILLELFLWPVSLDIRQTADVVLLKAAMQA